MKQLSALKLFFIRPLSSSLADDGKPRSRIEGLGCGVDDCQRLYQALNPKP